MERERDKKSPEPDLKFGPEPGSSARELSRPWGDSGGGCQQDGQRTQCPWSQRSMGAQGCFVCPLQPWLPYALLQVEGPMQYDAAIDPKVGGTGLARHTQGMWTRSRFPTTTMVQDGVRLW